MSSYKIEGQNQLFGEITIESSKNAILPILAGSVLSSGIVKITNVPEFSDIDNMLEILKVLGAKVIKQKDSVTIDPSLIHSTDLPKDITSKIRASIFLLGPLLSRFNKASSCQPGGCKIGKRPIDIHLNGFSELGIVVKEDNCNIYCDSTNFIGGNIRLRMPSVGATENLIMCAVLKYLKVTVIENAAKEPEIVDLCNFINSMGGKIYGAGTDKIVIVGVSKLKGVEYSPISDRIIAGTYMIATAMCGGKVLLKNARAEHNQSLITNLLSFGCLIDASSDNIYMQSTGKLGGGNKSISTSPYPGFATDLQAQTMAMLANCNGEHTICENLFETRFKQATELAKMGADISISGNNAIIHGRNNAYTGAEVESSDLRGGASLVLAGLCAKGTTIVKNIEYIERGYDGLDTKLSTLGANIQKII